MAAWLYTQESCGACEKARALLRNQGHTIREVRVDNPLLELGVGMLFKDKRVHTPVVFLEGEGIYILSSDIEPQLLRLVNLKHD